MRRLIGAALVAAMLLGGCTNASKGPSAHSPSTTSPSVAKSISAAEAYIRFPILLYNATTNQDTQGLSASIAGTPQAAADFTALENAAKVSRIKLLTISGPNLPPWMHIDLCWTSRHW